MTIRATIQTDGPFISLAFEVRPPDRLAGGAAAPEGPPHHAFGPLRLATVHDAVVLLSQVARYLDAPPGGGPERL